jgi:hypothetical protein
VAWPHEVQTELQAFYGKFQLGANGTPTEPWKAKNLTTFIAPYPLTLSWDLTKTATRVTCHKEGAGRLKTILQGQLSNSPASLQPIRLHKRCG